MASENESDNDDKDEGEDFEVLEIEEIWVDHSNATPWEEFINAIEEQLLKWNIVDSSTCASAQNKKKENGDFSFGSVDLNFEAKPFASLTLFCDTSIATKDLDKTIWGNGFFEHLTPASLHVLNVSGDIQKDFPMSTSNCFVHPLRRWFGVEEFMVLQATDSKGKHFGGLLNMNISGGNFSRFLSKDESLDTATLLLSSASIALSNSNTAIPTFVQTNTLKNRLGDSYQGVCVPGTLHGGATIYFETDICTKDDFNKLMPHSFQNLQGWLQFFKRKLKLESSDAYSNANTAPAERSDTSKTVSYMYRNTCTNNRLLQGDIFISVRRTYSLSRDGLQTPSLHRVHADKIGWSEWVDDDVSWRYQNKNSCLESSDRVTRALEGPRGVPLWGPLHDPIQSITLYNLWPIFREGAYVQNSVFSSLTPQTAPLWLIRVQFSDIVSWPIVKDSEEEASTGLSPNSTQTMDEQSGEEDVQAASTPLACSLKSLLYLVQEAESYPSDFMFSSFAANRFVDTSELEPNLDSNLQEQNNDDPDNNCETELFKVEFRSCNKEATLDEETAHQKERSGTKTNAFLSKPIRDRVGEMILELFLWSKESPSRRIGLNGRRVSHSKQFQQLLDEDIHEAEKLDPAVLRRAAHEKLLKNENDFNYIQQGKPGSYFVPENRCRFCISCENGKGSLKSSSSSTNKLKTSASIKAAPPGSILSILALRMIPEFGRNLPAVALLWREFVAELRWHWENSIPFPLTVEQRHNIFPFDEEYKIKEETITDDIKYMKKLFPSVSHHHCIIHQKLQLLNLCILMKIHKEKHEHGSQCMCNKIPKPHEEENDDEFFDANSQASSCGTSSSDDDKVHERHGHDMGEGVRIYGHSLETEDTFRDRQLMVEKYPELEEKLLFKNIRSDMQSYKACFPSAGKDSFTKWLLSVYRNHKYSNVETKKVLSNLNIDDLWEDLPGSCLFSQNLDSCFSAHAEAEKILHHLETISPSNCLYQLFCIGTVAASHILMHANTKASKLAAVKTACKLMKKNCKSALNNSISHYSSIAGGCQFKTPEEKILGEARLRSVIDDMRLCEGLLSKCTSMLNQLPYSAVERILADTSPFSQTNIAGRDATGIHSRPLKQYTNEFVATIEINEAKIRSQILNSMVRDKGLRYSCGEDETNNSYEEDLKKLAQFDKEEILMRCLGRKSCIQLPFVGDDMNENSQAECGANRMYVAITKSSVRIATAFTQTSF